MKKTSLLDMFKDDCTKQYSIARFLIFCIVLYCFISMYGKDMPFGWAGLVTALYFGNKGASTTKEIVDAKLANTIPPTD